MILNTPEQIREYTARGWWGNDTLYELFERNARATPDVLAVVDPPNRAELTTGTPLRLTYAELAQMVDRLASGLLDAGIGKDDVLMVQLPNIVELVAVYLAGARIGAVVSPLPVQYRTHELKQVLALAEPKAFITTSNFGGFNYVEMVQGLQPDFPSLLTLIANGDQLPPDVRSLKAMLTSAHDDARLQAYIGAHRVDANDTFTLCWTSGTEAEPKGVPRSHNLWVMVAYVTVDGALLERGSTLLNPFPLVNMSGIGGMLVPWLLTGGKLVLHHPLNLGVFLAQIKGEQANYTVAPPVLLNMLLLNPALLASTDLSTIRTIGSGSAPLSVWMVTQWKERYGIDVLNFFGSNEGTPFVSAPREVPDPAERARYFPRYGVAGFTWTNRAMQGMQTKLVDPLTKQVITQPNEPGELAIKGPTMFAGYYRRPDLTQKAFDADGYFYTGDLFAIDGDAATDEGLNRYRFVGRLKDLIIRGGMKISPEEIENLIMEHPQVADVAVVGYPNRRLNDETVCAVVVPKKDQTLTLSDVVDFLRAKDIAAYKLPKKLLVVAALPRNPVGKVLKRALRERFYENELSDDSPTPEAETTQTGD